MQWILQLRYQCQLFDQRKHPEVRMHMQTGYVECRPNGPPISRSDRFEGFYGDGLSCTAHFCSSDGDCGYNAHCLPDEQRPGFSKCVCDPGYLNDGTTFTTCVKDGTLTRDTPGQWVANCLPSFSCLLQYWKQVPYQCSVHLQWTHRSTCMSLPYWIQRWRDHLSTWTWEMSCKGSFPSVHSKHRF